MTQSKRVSHIHAAYFTCAPKKKIPEANPPRSLPAEQVGISTRLPVGVKGCRLMLAAEAQKSLLAPAFALLFMMKRSPPLTGLLTAWRSRSHMPALASCFLSLTKPLAVFRLTSFKGVICILVSLGKCYKMFLEPCSNCQIIR